MHVCLSSRQPLPSTSPAGCRAAACRRPRRQLVSRRQLKAPISPGTARGHGEWAATHTATTTTNSSSTQGPVIPPDSTAHPPPLTLEQLADMIHPGSDDFEEVAQQLPVIRAELGDQQALLLACNQFLEDMAERHLDLLLQQQSAQRLAASRPNTPTAAGAEAALQAYGKLEQQLQAVSAQLEQQRLQADELLQQKDALNKQLRVVTMEREELKQQLQYQAATAASSSTDIAAATVAAESAQLQETLQQLTDVQDRLSVAEVRLDEALQDNQALSAQLQAANSAAEAAMASALAATSTASAATHAHLQEASAKVEDLQAQLSAAHQLGKAVADTNGVLQEQVLQAHAQGGRLISMNRQLILHAEALEQRCQLQADVVAALREDKAAQAAELARIYIMLQEMQGAQQRQQQLQQQLLQIIARQQQKQQAASAEDGDASAAPSG